MQLQLQVDNKTPMNDGAIYHSTAWFGSLTAGPFMLLLDEMTGSKGHVTSCAITAEVPDTEAFENETISTLKLVNMIQPEIRADGSRSYFWDGFYGEGTTLLLRDFKPSGKPGVMLKLIAKDKVH